MTETYLIDAFLQGDKAAFNDLVRLWHTRIYNFVLRYVGDRDEASDLAQQTFIRAYTGLARLEDPDSFSTWIYRIAMNACRDAGRARQRRVMVDAEDEAVAVELQANPATRPDATTQAGELRDLLKPCTAIDSRRTTRRGDYEGV